MNELEIAVNLFKMRFTTEEILRNMNVVRSHKITEDYGEWLATRLFDGVLAENPNQVGWDFEANGIQYQVKTHHKAETTPARWSKLKTLDYSTIIFQLNPNYTIKNIFFISNHHLSDLNNQSALPLEGDKFTLHWSKCEKINEQFIDKYPFLFQ